MIAYGIIYLLTNTVNGKCYVGQTTKSLKRRFREHCRYDAKMLVCKAIRKNGSAAFKASELFSAVDKDALDAAEIAIIADLKTRHPAGYNLKEGGAHGKHHEVTCQKIGNSHRGKRVSKETALKISAANTGRKHSAESIARMTIANNSRGPETFAKISAANTGRRHTPEARAKMSQAALGRPKSSEHRAKLAAANIGKKASPETRAKLSAALRVRHAFKATGAQL